MHASIWRRSIEIVEVRDDKLHVEPFANPHCGCLALRCGVVCGAARTIGAGTDGNERNQHRPVCDGGVGYRPARPSAAGNYNIGIGHTFAFLKKDPLGDELTFSYMYENAGTHGFLHTNYGEHTDHWNPIAAATVLGQTKAPPSTPSPQNALPSQAKP